MAFADAGGPQDALRIVESTHATLIAPTTPREMKFRRARDAMDVSRSRLRTSDGGPGPDETEDCFLLPEGFRVLDADDGLSAHRLRGTLSERKEQRADRALQSMGFGAASGGRGGGSLALQRMRKSQSGADAAAAAYGQGAT